MNKDTEWLWLRWGKRVSHMLMLIILCVLILYVGIYMQIDVPKEEISLRINQMLMENAGKMFFAGLFYENENMELVEEAANMNFKEDEQTYEMILKLQESDEEQIEESENDESTGEIINIQENLGDFEYLLSHFYTVDSSTSVTENILDAKKLLKKDMTIKSKDKGPKILIYHTHSQEAFKDSKKGKTSDTIMGMGDYLAKLLNEKYGIETLHHEGVYDLIDGQLDRSKAYQLAEPNIRKILEENPTIEVVIDLHRDGVKESTHLVTEIDGKKTAKLMFFNGMSRTKANGEIAYLANPYIEDNLALSLQMQIYAKEMYPELTRRIYLKSYRYNMHLMPKSLLIEAGAQTNTVAEMKNSMKYLAEILHGVLTGEKRFD